MLWVVGSRNTSLKYIGLLWDLSPLVSPKSNHLFLGPLSAIPKKNVLLNLNSLSYLVNKNDRQTTPAVLCFKVAVNEKTKLIHLIVLDYSTHASESPEGGYLSGSAALIRHLRLISELQKMLAKHSQRWLLDRVGITPCPASSQPHPTPSFGWVRGRANCWPWSVQPTHRRAVGSPSDADRRKEVLFLSWLTFFRWSSVDISQYNL